jgi:hypothetical protein
MNLHGRSHVEPHVGNVCYRKLRVTRVILHRNLITATAIRDIFSIVVKIAINTDALLDKDNTVRNDTRRYLVNSYHVLAGYRLKGEAVRSFSPGKRQNIT